MSAPAAARDTTLVEDGCAIDQCSKCASHISLSPPTSAAPASAWLCRRCGSCYFARCTDDDSNSVRSGLRPISYGEVMKAIYVHMDGDSCPLISDVYCGTARGPSIFNGPDARKQKRYACPAQVTIVPLAKDFRVAAQPLRLKTKNVSGGGVALLNKRPITQPYLAIDFSASGIDLLPAIVQVLRVRQIAGGFEIAGKFISRILH